MAVVTWDFILRVVIVAAAFLTACSMAVVVTVAINEFIVMPALTWRSQKQAVAERAARDVANTQAEANASIARITATYLNASEALRTDSRQDRT